MAGTYRSPYQYECTEGHWLEGPKPLTVCPIARCESTLVPKNKKAEEHAATDR